MPLNDKSEGDSRQAAEGSGNERSYQMITDVVKRILFYKYDPSEGFWMKLLRLVPGLCFISALLIHVFLVRGNLG